MRAVIQSTVLLATLQSTTAYSQAPSIPQLQAAYLACSESAERGDMGRAEIIYCSVLYEELKRRAFDGDFERLLAWSRSEAGRRRPVGLPDSAASKD